MAGGHEERDIVEAVGVEAPHQREEDLAGGGEEQAGEEEGAAGGVAADPQQRENEPGRDVHGELAVGGPSLVDEQAHDDRGGDQDSHVLGIVPDPVLKRAAACRRYLPPYGTPNVRSCGRFLLTTCDATMSRVPPAACDPLH